VAAWLGADAVATAAPARQRTRSRIRRGDRCLGARAQGAQSPARRCGYEPGGNDRYGERFRDAAPVSKANPYYDRTSTWLGRSVKPAPSRIRRWSHPKEVFAMTRSDRRRPEEPDVVEIPASLPGNPVSLNGEMLDRFRPAFRRANWTCCWQPRLRSAGTSSRIPGWGHQSRGKI